MSEKRLGIVLCDLDTYSATQGRFTSHESPGLGTCPPGFFENPSSWPHLNTEYVVAKGVRVEPILRGAPHVDAAFGAALEKLGPCSLVITDCGFFFRARAATAGSTNSVITGSLDLIPTAAAMTHLDIGVLTVSAPEARGILDDHPLRSRMRIVGLEARSGWSGMIHDAFGIGNGWTVDVIASSLDEAMGEAFAQGGELDGIGALVLECTLLPQFRNLIGRHTTVPILDVATLALTVLGSEGPFPQWEPTQSQDVGSP